MNIKRTFPKFLRTFDGAAAPAPQPTFIMMPTQQPAPQPAPAPAPVISAEALPQVIDLTLRRMGVQSNVNNGPLAPVAPQPIAAPAPAVDPNAELTKQVQDLTKALNQQTEHTKQLQKQAEAAQLEAYRQSAIANVRAAGHNLIDALVFGKTTQEIDTSLSVAVAEYAHLQNQWLAGLAQSGQQVVPVPQQQQQAPQVQPLPQPQLPAWMRQQQPPQPQVQQPAVPQGYVAQQAPWQPQVQQQFQQSPQQLNVPGYVAAPNLPPQQEQGLDRAQLDALTSSDSVRNGTYAANRQALFSQLQGRGGPQGQPWAFNPGYNVAPAFPRGVPPQHGQQAPAMVPNAYAGVSMPQVRPQAGVLGQPMPAGYPHYGSPQAPQFAPVGAPVGAPTPYQLETGSAQLDGNGFVAAQNAAIAAINGARSNPNGAAARAQTLLHTR